MRQSVTAPTALLRQAICYPAVPVQREHMLWPTILPVHRAMQGRLQRAALPLATLAVPGSIRVEERLRAPTVTQGRTRRVTRRHALPVQRDRTRRLETRHVRRVTLGRIRQMAQRLARLARPG